MSVLVSLHHVTRYAYERAVALGPQVIRLRPAPHAHTRTQLLAEGHAGRASRELAERPARATGSRAVPSGKTGQFSVTVDLHAEMAPFNPFDFFIEPYAVTYPFTLPAEFAHELGGYLDLEPLGSRLRALPGRRAARPATCSF